jgi:hypothetical protein
MRFRKLRIAWSVGCAIACVLLIVLWIHSYRYQDYYAGWVSKSRSVSSLSENGWFEVGSTRFDIYKMDESEVGQLPAWEATSNLVEVDPIFGPPVGRPHKWRWASFNSRNKSYLQVWIPCWFPVVITAVVGGLPWLSKARRFSLRTLLIATTLVAVVLGLIVAMLRWPAG